ncbi:MAG: hypothetical protein DWQ44_01615 [Bacteroidetes bacterium]|nr:MAG: hypothetical protein DWQ33_05345 [Bacteroidota bacterium]REK04676.1 MAG: hypothetical protein DWQ39_05505 [Bacteroidota bacterium]REK36151.1 MAG: hypothetical protein DWQ44_01615 [Bacteroidota bacterium]REK51478.1 MAG: hypothetical protein DWQ48_01220 [Bacteroidota bacterium]
MIESGTISKQEDSNRIHLVISQFLFLSGIVFLWPFTRLYFDNPDTFQYLSLARKYSEGNFHLAINAYWSPMLSWLISLLLIAGIPGLIAFKFMQIMLGSFMIYQWKKLLDLFSMSKWSRVILLYTAVPFALSYAMIHTSADLLFLFSLLIFIRLLIRDLFHSDKRKHFYLLPFAGAFLYFSKAFGAPLFIFMLSAAELYRHYLKNDRGNLPLYFNRLTIFLLIIAPWIILISFKQGHFTVSEAATFNLSQEVSPRAGQTTFLPVLHNQLTEPQDSLALSAWEAPGETLREDNSGQPEEISEFREFLKLINRNLLSIWYYDFSRQPGIVFLILLAIALILRTKFRDEIRHPEIFLSLVLITAVYAGYSLILFHYRYSWICMFLMLLISAVCLERIFETSQNRIPVLVILSAICLLAIKRPVKEVLFSEDKDVSFFHLRMSLASPITALEVNFRPEKELKEILELFSNLPDESMRFASLDNPAFDRDTYSRSLMIAYNKRWQFIGQRDSINANELAEHIIDYFIVWKKSHENVEVPENFEQILKDEKGTMILYKTGSP